MNLYKKMYVVSEDEYRRLTESMQVSVSQFPTAHSDVDQNTFTPIEPEIVDAYDIDQTNKHKKKDKEMEKKERKKKKHKCNQCEKEYSDKHDLRRHKKKIHAKQDTDIKPQEEEEDTGIVIKNKNIKRQRQQRDPFRQKITKWRTMMMMM